MKWTTYNAINESSCKNHKNLLRLLLSHLFALLIIGIISCEIHYSCEEIFDGEIEYADFTTQQKILDFITIRW